MRLGSHSNLFSGRQNTNHTLLWCPLVILRDQQVYFSRNNPLLEKKWGVCTDNVWGLGWDIEAAASSTCGEICHTGRAESKRVGMEQPTLKGLGRKEKLVNETLTERKCLRKLWKGAVCGHAGCKMWLVNVVYLEDSLSLREQAYHLRWFQGGQQWPTLCNLLSPVLASSLPQKRLRGTQTAIIIWTAFGCWRP